MIGTTVSISSRDNKNVKIPDVRTIIQLRCRFSFWVRAIKKFLPHAPMSQIDIGGIRDTDIMLTHRYETKMKPSWALINAYSSHMYFGLETG